jgi:hypothetical protein
MPIAMMIAPKTMRNEYGSEKSRESRIFKSYHHYVRIRPWLTRVCIVVGEFSTVKLTPTAGVWLEGAGKVGLRTPGKSLSQIYIWQQWK